VYDIEVYADRFEQEVMYALECNAEQDLEHATQQRISEIEQKADDLLKRMDAQLEAVKALRSSLNPSTGQTAEETALFTEWLS